MCKAKKRKLLVMCHNCLSAGTLTQSVNYIDYIKHNPQSLEYHFIVPDTPEFRKLNSPDDQIFLHYIPYFKGFYGYLVRLVVELVAVPLVIRRVRPDSILALTNYFLVPYVPAKKVVLLRHPYITDESLTHVLTPYQKAIEFFRRRLFDVTLRLADHVIVQSAHMKAAFDTKFKHFKKDLSVLPNPISTSNFPADASPKVFAERSNILFYPSRYYPHKNHEFLIKLTEKHLSFFIDNHAKIIVTLNENAETRHLLEQITEKGLTDVIHNIGEVPQKELANIYKKAKILFFPSKSETFGNALAEGMFFRIPIIVPDLPYARTLCENAGAYYVPDDIDSAFETIKELITNGATWREKSKLSGERMKNSVNLDQWNDRVLKILTN